MIALLLSLALAADPPVDPDLLAPSPTTLDRGIERLEGLLATADETSATLARIHNQLAERLVAGRPACTDPEAGPRVLASAPTGTALRDQVQSARAQLLRVQELTTAPTIEPLAAEILAERLATLATRTRSHERRLLEMSAWHQKWVEPWERRCRAELSAMTTPDPPRPADPRPAAPPPPSPAP